MKIRDFLEVSFYPVLKMQLLCGCRIAIRKAFLPIDSNMIQEKAKSLYDDLKQKAGEASKAGEFSASRR